MAFIRCPSFHSEQQGIDSLGPPLQESQEEKDCVFVIGGVRDFTLSSRSTLEQYAGQAYIKITSVVTDLLNPSGSKGWLKTPVRKGLGSNAAATKVKGV